LKLHLSKLTCRSCGSVDAAEAALFLRSQALFEDPQGHAERQAISDAIRTLRTIQREKLGYPDWNKRQ